MRRLGRGCALLLAGVLLAVSGGAEAVAHGRKPPQGKLGTGGR